MKSLNNNIISFTYTDKEEERELINMVFSKETDATEKRKEWIEKYDKSV